MPQPSITKIHLKITYLKFHSNFLETNELSSHLDYQMDGTKWSTSLTWPCTSALLPIQLTPPLNSCGWHQAPPLTGAKEQSPISPRISPPQFKFKENQIFFLIQIRILVVMARANFGCNLMNRKWFAAKWNSHQIWIMSEKSLMNWAPGHHLFQKATNRESLAITATPTSTM